MGRWRPVWIGNHWRSLWRNHRLRGELLRLVWALLWFTACAMLMALVQIRGDSLYARHLQSTLGPVSSQEGRVIYDLIFANTQRTHNRRLFCPDDSLHSYIVVSLVMGAIHWSPITLIARIRRFFWLLGLGYLLRMCTLLGTIMPPSDETCMPQVRTLQESLAMMPALLFGRIHTCTDKIFSGHTLVATLLFCLWSNGLSQAGIRTFSLLFFYPFGHLLLMVTTSVLGRNHYMVDIIVSFLISLLLFHSYCWLLSVARLRKECDNNALLRTRQDEPSFLLQRLVLWCEGDDLWDSPEMLPYELDDNMADVTEMI